MQKVRATEPATTDGDVHGGANERRELDLISYFHEVWKLRLWVVLSAVVFASFGCVAALLLPKKYDATLVAMPVLGEGSGRLGELGALASQFGGLASLAGIDLPGKSRNEEALAVLQSERLTRQFITREKLLPTLYPSRWDAMRMQWKPGRRPGLWKASRDFEKLRHISQDRETGLVTITMRWKNPRQAADWANDLVALTNDDLRQEAIQEAQRSIDYLNTQADRTTEVELKSAIYSLLQEEIEKEMLARGRDQYALKVVDPAYVPEKPAWPRPVLFTLFLGCVGAFLALAAVYVKKVVSLARSG